MKTSIVAFLACAAISSAASAKLTASQFKGRYLSLHFKGADGKSINVALDRLQYQNPHYNMLNADAVKAQMLTLANLALANAKEKDTVLKLVAPYKLKTNDPIFMYVFNGEGSPDEVVAVLKLATHFKDKLNKGAKKPWNDKGNLSMTVKDFLFNNIGLNCNGFAGSYAHASGAPQSPRTSIIDYANPKRRIKKVAQIQAGDVMVWKNGKHITVIEKPLGGGKFKVVESASENEVHGLSDTVWEIKETGSDVLLGVPVTSGQPTRKAAYGGGREMYVATLK
jgi:hypothetical protein